MTEQSNVTEAILPGADYFGLDEADAWLNIGRRLVEQGYLNYERAGDLHTVTLATAAPEKEIVGRLWRATAHGDDDHRAWLLEAYTAFFAGQPVPAPRGLGNKEARIKELEAQVTALEAARKQA